MSSLIHSYPSNISHRQRGFTLLELVLVMLIIGLVASTPLVFIDNQDNQFRYEETLEKLELIERAVYLPQAYRGEPVLSGFVVDNGVLPPVLESGSAAIQPLINRNGTWNTDPSGDWEDYGLINPYLFSGTASVAEISTHPQLKGYRENYLSDGQDSSGQFLDSWGIPYTVSSSGANYTATYKGNDGNHPAAYDSVISKSFESSDWAVELNQIDITLSNASVAIHSIAVAVFENKAVDPGNDADRWNTYHFSVDPASGGIPTVGHSLSESWYLNGSVMSSASVAETMIPAGQHPVFILDDSEQVQAYDRLLVIPGATQPSLQFEVD